MVDFYDEAEAEINEDDPNDCTLTRSGDYECVKMVVTELQKVE